MYGARFARRTLEHKGRITPSSGEPSTEMALLEIAGALYLLLSCAMVLVAFVTYRRRKQPFAVDDLVKWLGLPGLLVWAFVALGLVAKILVIPFTGALHLWLWLNETLGSGGVAIILFAIAAIAALYAVDQQRRRRPEN